MDHDVVKIEQRLQDQPRWMFVTMDEGIVFMFPLMTGLLTRNLFIGALVGFICWQVWKRLKGDGGLQWVTAASYWFLPKIVSPYRSLPDSAIELWRG